MGNTRDISTNIRNKVMWSLSPPLFDIVLEILTDAIKQEKSITGTGIDQEVKPPLFNNDMIENLHNTRKIDDKTK